MDKYETLINFNKNTDPKTTAASSALDPYKTSNSQQKLNSVIPNLSVDNEFEDVQ